MSRTTRRAPAARLSATLLLLASIATAVAACGSGDGVTGTLGAPGLALSGNGGAVGNVVPSLVGSWFRLVYVPDSSGSVRTSETTLDFRGDGTLLRTVVARTLSFGFADQVVSTGTWRATSTTLTITIGTVGTTGAGGATGATGVDSTRIGVGFGTPLTGNPPFAPNPPFGPTTPTTAGDSLGTSAGSTTYTYSITTTSQGTTLLLNGVPFVRLTNTQ